MEIACLWNSISYDDRQKYEKLAIEDKKRFEHEVIIYVNNVDDKTSNNKLTTLDNLQEQCQYHKGYRISHDKRAWICFTCGKWADFGWAEKENEIHQKEWETYEKERRWVYRNQFDTYLDHYNFITTPLHQNYKDHFPEKYLSMKRFPDPKYDWQSNEDKQSN